MHNEKPRSERREGPDCLQNQRRYTKNLSFRASSWTAFHFTEMETCFFHLAQGTGLEPPRPRVTATAKTL